MKIILKNLSEKITYNENKEINNILNEITSEIRQICFSLNPTILRKCGLSFTMNNYIYQLNKHSEIIGSFNVFGDFLRYDEEIELNIYRVFQEAISNILKHSNASVYKVDMLFFPDRLILTIEDDGIGFDLRNIEQDKVEHMGIINMEDRIKKYNGEFFLISRKEEGTQIYICIEIYGEKVCSELL